LEIFNIGKDLFHNFFPDKNQLDENITGIIFTIKLEINEKYMNDIIDAFCKCKNEIKKIQIYRRNRFKYKKYQKYNTH